MRPHAVLVVVLAFGCASANEEPLVGSGGTGGSGASGGSAGSGGSGGAPTAGMSSGGSGGSAGSGSGGSSGAPSGGMPNGGGAGTPLGGAAGAGSGAGSSNAGSGAGLSSGGSSAGTSGGGGAGMASGGASAGTSNGGNGGMSNGGAAGTAGKGGSSSAGTGGTGGAGGCVENLACELSPPPTTGDLHQDCVNRINQFLTECACLPPLTRRTDGEACADQMAKYDADNDMAHAGIRAGICQPGGSQNSCPGYSSNQQVIGLCMQQMWDEGPPPTSTCTGACYEEHGHFINMTDPSVTKVACGFFTTSGGKVWAVQNFSR